MDLSPRDPVYIFADGRSTSAMPAPADYDGDGYTDIATVEPDGTWYIDYSGQGCIMGQPLPCFGSWDHVYSSFEADNVRPIPADYDGDGKADLAIRTSDGWAVDYSLYGGFGLADDSFSAYTSNLNNLIFLPGNFHANTDVVKDYSEMERPGDVANTIFDFVWYLHISSASGTWQNSSFLRW